MRKVTLGLANSLDNYIARKDGGSDWLHWSDEVAEISSKFLKTVDVILIGRKTYEVMLGFGQTSYPGAKNYVFSRSKKKAATLQKALAAKKKLDKNVEIVTADATRFVRELKKSRKGKGICLFGGGELARSLFETDLIDEVARLEQVSVFQRFALMRYWKTSAEIPFEAFLSDDLFHMNDWSYGCMAETLARAIVAALPQKPVEEASSTVSAMSPRPVPVEQ